MQQHLPLPLKGLTRELSVVTNRLMPISFDPAKSRRNASDRGLSFEAVERFERNSCLLGISPRQEVTTTRFVATGYLDADLVTVVFTIHKGGVRVISLRRASRKERRLYHAE